MTPPITAPPRRRWFQFRLRTLLIAVTLLALPLGWFSHRLRQAERQRDTVAKLREMGFVVLKDSHDTGCANQGKGEATWASKILGDDFFDRITFVNGMEEYPGDLDRLPACEALRLVATLHDLQSLRLTGQQAVDDSNAGQLQSLRKLRRLDLSSTQAGAGGLACLESIPDLEVLDLTETPLTDNGLRHLKSLHKLKYLYLNNTGISGGHLTCLNGLISLETLQLFGTKIPLTDFGKLKLPQLQSLSISWFEYGPGPISESISPDLFTGMPNLETLEIRGYGAQPGLMAAIVRLPHIQRLDLTGVALDDIELEHIDRLQRLAILKLRGAKISDLGLRSLARSPELSSVCLNIPLEGEPLSPRGFAELQRARPNLHIAFGVAESIYTLPAPEPP